MRVLREELSFNRHTNDNEGTMTQDAKNKKEARALSGMGSLSGTTKHGAFAYFPGTGPQGVSCRSCRHAHVGPTKDIKDALSGLCGKYRDLMVGLKGKQPQIPLSTASCKYFEQRPN